MSLGLRIYVIFTFLYVQYLLIDKEGRGKIKSSVPLFQIWYMQVWQFIDT